MLIPRVALVGSLTLRLKRSKDVAAIRRFGSRSPKSLVSGSVAET